jgi:hypothetical protein
VSAWVDYRAARGLFFLGGFLSGGGFEILGFEDLTAIQALDVIHTIASGEEFSSLMRTRGLHRARLVLF